MHRMKIGFSVKSSNKITNSIISFRRTKLPYQSRPICVEKFFVEFCKIFFMIFIFCMPSLVFLLVRRNKQKKKTRLVSANHNHLSTGWDMMRSSKSEPHFWCDSFIEEIEQVKKNTSKLNKWHRHFQSKAFDRKPQHVIKVTKFGILINSHCDLFFWLDGFSGLLRKTTNRNVIEPIWCETF